MTGRNAGWDARAGDDEARTYASRSSTGVFVGVRRFKLDDFGELACAVDDAVDLAHLFSAELELIPPDRLSLALSGEPWKEVTRARLDHLVADGARRLEADRNMIIHEALTRANSSTGGEHFVLSFATHGFDDRQGDQFVATADTSRQSPNTTGIELSQLRKVLTKSKTCWRLLFLDACRESFSETRSLRGIVATRGEAFRAELRRFEDAAVFCAAPSGGLAFEDRDGGNGVFTAALIEGLRGAAEANERGYLTLGALAAHLNRRVREWVERKYPQDFEAREYGIDGPSSELLRQTDFLSLVNLRRRRFEKRRRMALDLLRRNLQTPLTGRHFDTVVDLLRGDDSVPAQEELLEEIEHLDGTARARRTLAFFLGALPKEGAEAARVPDEATILFRQGLELWRGLCGAVDRAEGERRLRRSAEAGGVAAKLYLIVLERMGSIGFVNNPPANDRLRAEDVDRLRREAELGSVEAAFVLGEVAADGLALDGDRSAAERWLRYAADAGMTAAMTSLAFHLWRWREEGQEPVETLYWYRRAAEAGDTVAIYNLGYIYQTGSGVAQDLAEGARHYRQAAEAGNPLAMRSLAICYERARGVEKNDEQSAAWYLRAAELGDAAATGSLAMCYLGGWGVRRDPAKALAWARRGADLQNPYATTLLGALYADGEVVSRDWSQAVAWYRKAADLGSTRAMLALGKLYSRGEGVERDQALATDWIRKAAEAGDGEAMRILGDRYQSGQGTEKSEEQALIWYRRAIEAGDEVAPKILASRDRADQKKRAAAPRPLWKKILDSF